MMFHAVLTLFMLSGIMPDVNTTATPLATAPGAGESWWDRTSPTVRRRLPSGRSLLGAALVAVSVGGVLVAHRSAVRPPDEGYLVVTTEVPAGHRLVQGDLGIVRIDLPQGLRAVRVDALQQVLGRQVRTDLHRLDLVRPGDLVATGGLGRPGTVQVALDVPAARVPGGALHPGARVDVLSTDESGQGTAVLAQDLPVVDADAPGGTGIGTSDRVGVRLQAPDRATAVRLADAAVRTELTLIAPTGPQRTSRGG